MEVLGGSIVDFVVALVIPFMVDSVCLVVEEFREGEEFGKGCFDDIEEFFAGDTVELVC